MNKRSILGFAVGPFASALISMLLVPICAWIFSSEDVGRLALLQIVINFSVQILSLGLDQAYIREYHEASNKNILLFNSIVPPVTMVIIGLAIFYSLGLRLSPYIFSLSDPLIELCLVVFILQSIMLRFFSLVLRMEERGLLFSFVQVAQKLLLLILILLLWFLSPNLGFISLIVINTTAGFFALLGLIVVISSNLKGLRPSMLSLDLIKSLMRFGLPLVIGGLAYFALISADRVSIRLFSNFSELAIYSVACSFAGAAIIFQSIFSTIWAPIVYKKSANNESMAVVDQVSGVVLCCVVMIFTISGMLSFIIPLMLPEKYNEVKYIFSACMAYPLFYTLSEVYFVGVALSRKSHLSLAVSVASAAIGIALLYVLVPLQGAAGAAIAIAIAFWAFMILRFELAVRIWRPFSRLEVYFWSLVCLFICISTAVFGRSYNKYFIILWVVIFLGNLVYNFKLIKSVFKFLHEKLIG